MCYVQVLRAAGEVPGGVAALQQEHAQRYARDHAAQLAAPSKGKGKGKGQAVATGVGARAGAAGRRELGGGRGKTMTPQATAGDPELVFARESWETLKPRLQVRHARPHADVWPCWCRYPTPA